MKKRMGKHGEKVDLILRVDLVKNFLNTLKVCRNFTFDLLFDDGKFVLGGAWNHR